MSHEIPDQFDHEDHVQSSAREDAGAFITAFSERYNMPIGVAFAAITDVLEEFRGEIGNRKSEIGNTEMPFKVSIIKILEYFFRKPSRTTIFAVCYAMNDPLIDDIIGHRTMAEFARSISVTKEAVRKEVKLAQEHFGWSPRPEQRNPESRAKMSARRIAQLNHKDTKKAK